MLFLKPTEQINKRNIFRATSGYSCIVPRAPNSSSPWSFYSLAFQFSLPECEQNESFLSILSCSLTRCTTSATRNSPPVPINDCSAATTAQHVANRVCCFDRWLEAFSVVRASVELRTTFFRIIDRRGEHSKLVASNSVIPARLCRKKYDYVFVFTYGNRCQSDS